MDMKSRRTGAGLLVLVALAGLLIYIASTRGLGWRLGAVLAAPASLSGPFATEEAWIVDDIARDIAEMAVYPAKRPPALVITSSGVAGSYRVALGPSKVANELDLREELWSPARFAVLARAWLTGSAAPATASFAATHPALLAATPASLLAASTAISKTLATDMRNARAHEAAALTLGAFALRESAGRFSDTRWAMNRMTAHLAMAIATRGDAEPGPDARLASIILLLLTDRQTLALDEIRALPRESALEAWGRALHVRITQDARTIANPAIASPLEKREYFRAYRATVPSQRADILLGQLAIQPGIDWYRVIEASGVGVDDGNAVIDTVLGSEFHEADDVFHQMYGRPLADITAALSVEFLDTIEHGLSGELDDTVKAQIADKIAQQRAAAAKAREQITAALNARAGRCVGDSGPQVLPWGAWAEFSQRHLAMFIGKSDNHYRHILGIEKEADADKKRLTFQLGKLSIFPLATIFWTKGVRGGDADLTLINEAISFASSAPERVTAPPWSFLARGTRYEPVRRGFPPPNTWFIAPAPRASYEASLRLKETEPLGSTREGIAAMLKAAPYDSGLAADMLRIKYGEKPPPAAVREAFGPRLEYDVRVLRIARGYAVNDDAERTRLARAACALSSSDCIAYGADLATAGREQEAAASYERAFADPAIDEIAMSNANAWLVTYYYRHGRTPAAIALAERGRDTGSWSGLVTAAYLEERLGHAKNAEELYSQAATRYDNPSQLLGFYYRAVNVRKQMEFEAAWKTALATVFPNGLVPQTTDDAKPARGVVVTKHSQASSKVGLQSDDIIVGLEGWRVETLQQYTAINAFFEKEQVTLTAWRGHLFPVAFSSPTRLLGNDLRTYPIMGWRER